MTFTSYSDFNEAILHELGNKHGFEVFSTGMNQFYSIRSEEVNFTISVEDDNSDWKNRIYRGRISVSASVRKMGGNPTVEELLHTADEIARAARLVQEIESCDPRLELRF